MEFKHIPVMLKECIEGLNIKPDGVYIDGTVGGAGHSVEIADRLGYNGQLIGIDRDLFAIQTASQRLSPYSNVQLIHDNHDNIKKIMKTLNVPGVDGILLDLGVSSHQLDERERGFSYMGEGQLDMRMDTTQALTAWTVVNTYKEADLAQLIFEYGEERYAKRIAKVICEKRKKKTIDTTTELAKLIESCVPYNKNDGHPAKRTFQAIRIEVNDELHPLYKTITECVSVLNPQGRLCVLTFHSLEDKMVKKAMADCAGKCKCPPGLPYCSCGARSNGIVITHKPILPSADEIKKNPRSKSAKLRIFERKGVFNID